MNSAIGGVLPNWGTAEIFRSSKPILLDFWAEWCGPCKALNPVLAEVAAAMPHIDLVKVNVGEQGELANEFGIKSLPTLLVVANGAVRCQIRGSTKHELIRQVQEALR